MPLRLLDELEDHGEGGLIRQAALRANGAVAHRRERALDGVHRPQMLPVLGGKIVEGERRVAVFLQTGGGLLVCRRVALDTIVTLFIAAACSERTFGGGSGVHSRSPTPCLAVERASQKHDEARAACTG